MNGSTPKKLAANLKKADRALILLQDFVRECRGAFEKDDEVPGADAVDYLAALYESAKKIVKGGK